MSLIPKINLLPKRKESKIVTAKTRDINIIKDGQKIGAIGFDIKTGAVSLKPEEGIFLMEGNTISFGSKMDPKPSVKLEIK